MQFCCVTFAKSCMMVRYGANDLTQRKIYSCFDRLAVHTLRCTNVRCIRLAG